jgi:hypothetical protein
VCNMLRTGLLLSLASWASGAVFTDVAQLPRVTFDFIIVGGNLGVYDHYTRLMKATNSYFLRWYRGFSAGE